MSVLIKGQEIFVEQNLGGFQTAILNALYKRNLLKKIYADLKESQKDLKGSWGNAITSAHIMANAIEITPR